MKNCLDVGKLAFAAAAEASLALPLRLWHANTHFRFVSILLFFLFPLLSCLAHKEVFVEARVWG